MGEENREERWWKLNERGGGKRGERDGKKKDIKKRGGRTKQRVKKGGEGKKVGKRIDREKTTRKNEIIGFGERREREVEKVG